MKIVIRDKGINLTIPIPMFLISSGAKLTKFIQKRLIKEHMKDENAKRASEIIEALDMDIIAIMLKDLKAYKGLHLLEVEGKDGSYVLIKI